MSDSKLIRHPARWIAATAFIVVVVSCVWGWMNFGRQRSHVSASEDQVIAEALWTLAMSELADPSDSGEQMENARRRFPNSARVAYWHGRIGDHEGNLADVNDRLQETLERIIQPSDAEMATADPVVKRKYSSARQYAKTIRERLSNRNAKTSPENSSESFLMSLLDAVSIDPDFTSAWAAMLESPDMPTAIAAAEAWAEILASTAESVGRN